MEALARWPFRGRPVAVPTGRSRGAVALQDLSRPGTRWCRPGFHRGPRRAIRIRLTQVCADGAMLTTLSDMAASGELALSVAETYPLEEAAKAHARLAASGLRGRIVLTME
ncbi:zinc-binding dehydrogenase [Streptomyces sp. NPDC093568]|uniref:zinc-binding dehydrogenase n=1 Tax=Streptomyces sp. NPDC093568 TaxID=3366041 RepID=UPI003814D2F0